MDVELFEEFGMIAKHGNLSEAARELHVTQSALSRHLSTLEKRFGVELFDRATSPMRLTPEGEAFLHWSSVISNSYKKMTDSMNGFRGNRPQVLRASGLLESDTAAVFKAACRSLKDEDPRFSVSLLADVGQTPFDLIRSGDLDVAVEPFSGMVDVHDMQSIPIARETSHILMERTHPWADRSALGLDDIRMGSFVSLRTNKDHANRKHLQDICRRHGFPGDVPGNLETRNSSSFSEVLLAGLNDGLLMLPESVAKRLCANERGEYVSIPCEVPECDYDIRLFYSKTPAAPALRLVERLTLMFP
jgi:LysR family transcriptional regulator, transcriptional activator of the cysJI operon